MAKLFNRAKMTTSTTGSGTVTLSAAAVGFQSFSDAGVSNGDVVQYLIEEGAAWEIGTGTYSSTGTSLTRTPSESSDGGTAITLNGAASVAITAVADDLNRLQHEGSTKVSVSATGASVTGALTTSGDLTVNGEVAADLSFGDSTKAKFGAGDDLQIYHDGSDSWITEGGSGTGSLKIRANNLLAYSNSDEPYFQGITNGAFRIYYDGSTKLSTTSTGVSVTNQLDIGGNDTGGAGLVHVYGGSTGEGGEIRIFPSAAEDTTVDSWSIDVASDDLRIFNSLGDMAASFNVNGGVDLYYDNSRKFHTYSGGGYVTGSLYASQSVTIGTGGNYQAGSLFSNGDWGMIFRAAQLNPTTAHFMWADYSNNELMRLNTSGNLSIGTTVGSNKLVLGGETAQYPEALNILETGHATSTRAGLKTGGWVFGQDATGLGTRDFFIYDGNTAQSRFVIDTSGELLSYQSNTTSAPTTFGAATGQIFRNENSEFAFGLLNVSPYPLYIQGRNNANAARNIVLQPSGGRIGIGETNPQRDLHITNSTAAEIALTDSGAGRTHTIVSDGTQISLRGDSSYGNIIAIDGTNSYFTVRTNNSEKMRVDANGNLWLYGTGTGDQRIEVGYGSTGNHFSYIDLIGDATYTDYGLRLMRGNGGANTYSTLQHRGTGQFSIHAVDAAPIILYTSNVGRLNLDSSGNMQLGSFATATGGRYFDIYNTGSTSTDHAIMRFITQQVGSATTTSADIIKRKNGELRISNNETNAAGYMAFNVGSSERMKIDSSGRVGIGTGTPIGNLTIYENITSVPNYWNGLQVEVRATTGTAGIGLHRSGYSHVGIYHDAVNRLSFNMSSGTVHVHHDAGTLYGTGNSQASMAWGNLNGIGTISLRDSYNVSSVTDGGTGIYTFNLSSSMSDANYGLQLSCGGTFNVDAQINANPTASAISVTTRYSSSDSLHERDVAYVTMNTFGELA